MTPALLPCLLLLLAAAAASAESISFSCSGADCSLAARWPWEAAVSASLSVSSSNLSLVSVAANGSEVWNGSARGNDSGTVDATYVAEKYPNQSQWSPGGGLFLGSTGWAGRIGTNWNRIVFAPLRGHDSPWATVEKWETHDSAVFAVEAREALGPFDVRGVAWGTQPNWSGPYWTSSTGDLDLSPLRVPLAANGTLLKVANETDYAGHYVGRGPPAAWTGRTSDNGAVALSFGPLALPINITGPNLTVAGPVETDAAWVTGYATVEGANVSANFTLNGTVNFTLRTMTAVPVKRGTYTANARFGGLGCESGAASIEVAWNRTFGCVIVGSPPAPVNRPAFASSGGGGGGGAPATTASPTPSPFPTSFPGGGAPGEGPVSQPIAPPPACSPGSLVVRNESGVLASLRCRADGSGWDPETNFTAEERSFAIQELNRSGLVPPVPSPGFEAVFAILGFLFAARWAGRRRDG